MLKSPCFLLCKGYMLVLALSVEGNNQILPNYAFHTVVICLSPIFQMKQSVPLFSSCARQLETGAILTFPEILTFPPSDLHLQSSEQDWLYPGLRLQGWAGGDSLLSSLSQRLKSRTYSGKPVQEVLNTHQKDLPSINLDHNCIKESPSPPLLPNSACSQEMHANHLNPGTAVLHLLINFLRVLIHIHSLPYFFPPEECIFQSV